jgi:DNA polymerase-3 subunit alpha
MSSTTRKPDRFVNLHGHSVAGSPGDAIDFPDQHIDWAIKNGSNAMALTDHGNMQGISFFKLHEQKVNAKRGPTDKFKAISGVEAYFIDSLSTWRDLYDADKLAKRKAEVTRIKQEAAAGLLGDEARQVAELAASASDNLPGASTAGNVNDEEDNEKTVVENEEESKSNKWSNPLYQRNHIVLLPKNSEGLKILFRIVSESNTEGFYRYPRVDLDMLGRYSKGNIVALSACLAGRLSRVVFDHQTSSSDFKLWTPDSNDNFELIQSELARMIAKFKEALGEENYYLELQFNKIPAQSLVNRHLMEAAKRTGTKLVVTCDSHYADPSHWREREIYKAMAWATKTKGTIDINKIPASFDQLECELYPKNSDQIWDSYNVFCKRQYPDVYTDDGLIAEAIERTHDIAFQQIGDLEFDTKIKYPGIGKLIDADRLKELTVRFNTSSEDDLVFKELVFRCIDGLKFRRKANDNTYIERLKYELEVIKHLNMQKYFLTYAKILEIVSKHILTGPGRGSAAGSLVLYTLNITQVDPIKYGLLFERFQTKYKKGAADIDLDYSDREMALKLITEHFGESAVLPVTNFNQLKLKSLIKDLARMYDLPFDEINKATYEIEKEARNEARKAEDYDAGTWVLTFEEASRHSPTFLKLLEKYPDLEASIRVLFKQVRGLSTHASGVGIYTGDPSEMPVVKFGSKFQTPWPEGQNYRHLEAFGILKYDVLGLGTLRMFEKCIERILKQQTGKRYVSFKEISDWYYQNVHPDNTNLDDLEVYKNIFWTKRETGVFQWVADNVKEFTANLQPKSIEDLSAITATFRPGPLKAGVDKLLLRNRKDAAAAIASLPNAALEPILAPTNYALIYQEQIQLVFNQLAGVPLEKTDDVRKAFTKRDLSNLQKSQAERKRLRDEFIAGCAAHSNIKEADAVAIFDYMEKYVLYSFNKSHSFSYAIVAYQCAWFQHYYPDEWIATFVDYCTVDKGKVTGKEDPKAIAIKDAKRLGYVVQRPDINSSDVEFTVDKAATPKALVPSFASMKHVGTAAVNEIKQFRPYRNVQDLLVNGDGTWRHSKFNKRALSTLIKLEALGSLNIVGDGLLFKNYKQAHTVLIDQYDTFKRISARKKNNDISQPLNEAIASVQDMQDWSKAEKLEFSKELAGSVDFDLIVSPEVRGRLDELGFMSIDSWEEKGNYWAIIASAVMAKTKTGKDYLKLRLFAEQGKEHTCFIWGWKGPVSVKENDVVVGLFDRNDFGVTCYQNKLFKVNEPEG